MSSCTLRSQMIAGATAVASVGSIALTPIAPAVSLPSLSQIKSEVSLSAFADPVSALLNTTAVVGNYFLNGVYGTAAANWPGSGTFIYPDGIGAYVSGGIPGNTGISTPGIIRTATNNPFPIASALLHNWLGYGQLAGDAATILSAIATRATAALDFLLKAATRLPILIAAQVKLLMGSMSGVLNSVVAASSAPNPVEGVWNALVNGLLDASVSGSLPATVINLTVGAGIQYAPVTAATPPYVPSIRAIGTAVLGGLANVIDTTRGAGCGSSCYPPEEDNVISDDDIYWNNYNYSARSSGPASATAAAPVARAARAAAAGDSSSATDQGNSAAADRPKAARAHAARADR